jgi:D-threo-aldose 1-dehydrogenase
VTPRASDLVELGRRKLCATALGLGGGPLGGLFAPVGADQAEATVEAAWSAGVRLFDVAPLYGHGRSEELVGRVLARKPRSAYVVSTKVGRLLRPDAAGQPSQFAEPGNVGPRFDFSADGVVRSLAESLERLGLDRVDVAYVHDPEEHLDQALGEAWPALVKLRDQGVVDAIGVGTNSTNTVARFVRECEIDCVLLANRLNLIDQTAAVEAVPLCLEGGVAVLIGGVFATGILASPTRDAVYEYHPAPADIRARVRKLDRVCAAHGVSLRSAALQYPFRFKAVTAVLAGARSPRELKDAVSDLETQVPDALWADLERQDVRVHA